jgi:hypothetical protein
VYLQGKFPHHRRHQPDPKDEIKMEQVKKNVTKVRDCNYFEKGPAISLSGYFDVSKTLFNI